MKIRRIFAAVIAAGALAGGSAATNAHADQMSPFVPDAAVLVPRQRTGIVGERIRRLLRGQDLPRWHPTERVPFWQPIRCIIPDGSINPPLAPPGGCGGVLG